LGVVTFNVPADKEEEIGITKASPRRTTKEYENRRLMPLSYSDVEGVGITSSSAPHL
jgi:hypothetical protein